MGFSPETGEIQPHRTVSRLALAAGFVTLLSPTALIHPLLVVVPLAAAVLSFLTLLTINSEQVGRTLAICALVPALGFAAYSPTRYFSRQQRVFESAERYANQWLQLIAEGRSFEAHQLSLTAFERQSPDVDLAVHYADPMTDVEGIPTEEQLHAPFVDLQEFLAQDPVVRVLTWPDGFDVEKLAVRESIRGTTESETVSLAYRLTAKGAAEGEIAHINIVMQRFIRNSVAYWRVLEFSDPDVFRPTPR